RVAAVSDRLPPPMNKPPPLPMGMLPLMPAALPLNSLLVMVVDGPPVATPPPLAPAELLRNRLFCTTRVPRLASSAKPAPKPGGKLWAMVLLLMVTVLLPDCPRPPPNMPAVLPLTTDFVTFSTAVPLSMASSHTPAPWLRQVLSATVELLITT